MRLLKLETILAGLVHVNPRYVIQISRAGNQDGVCRVLLASPGTYYDVKMSEAQLVSMVNDALAN